MYAVLAIFVTSGGIGSWPSTAAGTIDTSTNSLNYRDVLACGPNSLFMFLILSGHSDVTLEQLQDLPVSPEGTSLMALSDAARKFQVDAEIRRYRPEEIDLIHLPAIGQFKTSITSITPLHFDVIYKVDADRVYLLDGTTGFQYSIRRSRLPDFWTGFAMTEKRPIGALVMNKWWPALLGACLLIVDCIILKFFIRWFSYRKSVKVMSEAEVVA